MPTSESLRALTADLDDTGPVTGCELHGIVSVVPHQVLDHNTRVTEEEAAFRAYYGLECAYSAK
eukprot:3162920-Amphidinium_carterae.1